MTKREYIARYVAAVYFDLASADTSYGLREISKTLVNIANELERMSPIEFDAPEAPETEKDLPGGAKVLSPVPPPVMPSPGHSNPLEAIAAMLSKQ